MTDLLGGTLQAMVRERATDDMAERLDRGWDEPPRDAPIGDGDASSTPRHPSGGACAPRPFPPSECADGSFPTDPIPARDAGPAIGPRSESAIYETSYAH